MSAPNERPEDGKPGGERIAKVIARSGLCSRRDAEILIGEKRVSVNGAAIESAALDVSPTDAILVDGRPIAEREPPRLWRYHKPKGRVTTHKDPEGRPTVFEALPEDLPRLISVGRLDFNTEGLLLLTNDGDLARHIELPSTGWARRYRVRAYGEIEQSKLDELAGGLRTGGVNYGPIEAKLEREQGDNVWITLLIREGKNREVRRIMEHLGLTVNRLIRVSFGPFILGDMEPGQIEEVKTSVLKDQLGPRLSRQLGVKRDPLREERRLAPARSKPTYLRRKPTAPPRPERAAEERPLRRRRILAMDGSEAPKVELVPEKKRHTDRFADGPQKAERSSFRSREERPARERGPRPEGERRFSARPQRDDRERAPRPEGERRFSARPQREDRERTPRPEGERRFSARPQREDRERAPRPEGERRFSARPQREDRERAPRPEGERRFSGRPRREDRERTPRPEGERRFSARPQREDRERAPRPEGERRFSGKPRREAAAEAGRPPRAGDMRRAEGRSAAPRGKPEGDRPPWKSRPEQGAEQARPKFRKRDGDGRPFRQDREAGEPGKFRAGAARRPEGRSEAPRFAREGRADDAPGAARKPKTFEKRAFDKGPGRGGGAGKGSGKPFKRREAAAGEKPFKRRDGPAKGPRPGGPRKPRPPADKDKS